MNEDSLLKIINKVNNGDWDEISHYFNDDLGLFLSIIERKGLLHTIDPFTIATRDEQNLLLLHLMNSDKEKWTRIICEKIINNDIVVKDGGYYLYLKDVSELSNLFKGGNYRDSSCRDVAEHVLGDDYHEFFHISYEHIDITNDVLDNLNKESLSQLKNRLFNELNGKEIEASTEVLEEHQDEDGNVTINKDIWPLISNDSETLEHLIKNTEINLYGLYSNCYESAYQSEVYDKVWSELNTFFEGKPQHLSRLNQNSGKKIYYSLLKIRDVSSVIMDFLDNNKNEGWEYTLEYNGSFMYVLNVCMDQGVYDKLDFRIPDYPDYRYVVDCLNDNIGDIY